LSAARHNNPGAADCPKPLVVLQGFRQPLTRNVGQLGILVGIVLFSYLLEIDIKFICIVGWENYKRLY
jgi:hypothetical protein